MHARIYKNMENDNLCFIDNYFRFKKKLYKKMWQSISI